jgi:hypothetical protein
MQEYHRSPWTEVRGEKGMMVAALILVRADACTSAVLTMGKGLNRRRYLWLPVSYT